MPRLGRPSDRHIRLTYQYAVCDVLVRMQAVAHKRDLVVGDEGVDEADTTVRGSRHNAWTMVTHARVATVKRLVGQLGVLFRAQDAPARLCGSLACRSLEYGSVFIVDAAEEWQPHIHH